MIPTEQKTAARDFAAFWFGKGYEKGQTQPFWLSLLRVLGVEHPERFIEFEDMAHIDARYGGIRVQGWNEGKQMRGGTL